MADKKVIDVPSSEVVGDELRDLLRERDVGKLVPTKRTAAKRVPTGLRQGLHPESDPIVPPATARREVVIGQEIGPNKRAAEVEKAKQESLAKQEEARQKSASEQEKARQSSAAEQEKARQESTAKQEEARQRSVARQHAETQKTIRFAIAAGLSFLILIFTAFLLWLAKEKNWPDAAYVVIGSLGGLTAIGSGVIAARQTKKEKEGD